jgi:hypothetical protein
MVSAAISTNSYALITACSFLGTHPKLVVRTASHVDESNNILQGNRNSTLWIIDRSTMDFHNDHILNDGGFSVVLDTYLFLPPVYIDLIDNFWGTSDPGLGPRLCTWRRPIQGPSLSGQTTSPQAATL